MGVLAGLLLALATPLAAEQAEVLPISLALYGLDGVELQVEELRGQWVVLNYWATWCAPCRKEIPDLSDLHDRRPDITVLGLAYEDASIEDFEAFLEEFPASYPILLVDVLDPPQPFGAPRALPTTIILDPAGVPVKTFVGPVSGAAIEEFIIVHGGP